MSRFTFLLLSGALAGASCSSDPPSASNGSRDAASAQGGAPGLLQPDGAKQPVVDANDAEAGGAEDGSVGVAGSVMPAMPDAPSTDGNPADAAATDAGDMEADARDGGSMFEAGPCGVGAAHSWPEADALFLHDPAWLGADAAYSVDLGNGRILWLFGDTFIAKSAARVRTDAWFIRNSVAVQSGSANPANASATFAWRTTSGMASSFFPEQAAHWFWPLGGVRMPSRLVLFLLEEQSSTGGLGFETVGTRVFFVSNPDDPPSMWSITQGFLPSFSFPIAFGAAVVKDGAYVYAFGDREPGDHSVYLARFDATSLDVGDASSPLFWTVDHFAPPTASPPTTIFPSASILENPPAELSVQKRADGSWAAVHSIGFGATQIALRTSPAPTGPWSGPCSIFTPPESGQANTLVYAAKAHPELSGGALVMTYAANSTDLYALTHDLNLYFPRFVRTDGP